MTMALDRRHTLGELLQREMDRPGNGGGDIYWIEASVLESLRPPR
jgi:hypothetical protein